MLKFWKYNQYKPVPSIDSDKESISNQKLDTKISIDSNLSSCFSTDNAKYEKVQYTNATQSKKHSINIDNIIKNIKNLSQKALDTYQSIAKSPIVQTTMQEAKAIQLSTQKYIAKQCNKLKQKVLYYFLVGSRKYKKELDIYRTKDKNDTFFKSKYDNTRDGKSFFSQFYQIATIIECNGNIEKFKQTELYKKLHFPYIEIITELVENNSIPPSELKVQKMLQKIEDSLCSMRLEKIDIYNTDVLDIYEKIHCHDTRNYKKSEYSNKYIRKNIETISKLVEKYETQGYIYEKQFIQNQLKKYLKQGFLSPVYYDILMQRTEAKVPYAKYAHKLAEAIQDECVFNGQPFPHEKAYKNYIKYGDHLLEMREICLSELKNEYKNNFQNLKQQGLIRHIDSYAKYWNENVKGTKVQIDVKKYSRLCSPRTYLIRTPDGGCASITEKDKYIFKSYEDEQEIDNILTQKNQHMYSNFVTGYYKLSSKNVNIEILNKSHEIFNDTIYYRYNLNVNDQKIEYKFSVDNKSKNRAFNDDILANENHIEKIEELYNQKIEQKIPPFALSIYDITKEIPDNVDCMDILRHIKTLKIYQQDPDVQQKIDVIYNTLEKVLGRMHDNKKVWDYKRYTNENLNSEELLLWLKKTNAYRQNKNITRMVHKFEFMTHINRSFEQNNDKYRKLLAYINIINNFDYKESTIHSWIDSIDLPTQEKQLIKKLLTYRNNIAKYINNNSSYNDKDFESFANMLFIQNNYTKQVSY